MQKEMMKILKDFEAELQQLELRNQMEEVSKKPTFFEGWNS